MKIIGSIRRTVTSLGALNMILEHAGRVELASSGTSNVLEAKEWKWVWGLQLPPKIRTFLQRACNDAIPVNVAMVRRKIGCTPFVPYVRFTSRVQRIHFLNMTGLHVSGAPRLFLSIYRWRGGVLVPGFGCLGATSINKGLCLRWWYADGYGG